MITNVLIKLFEKDLNRVTDEINQYPDDSSLWVVKDGINNSGGNLCLHLAGSLQHFIGAELGGSGYVRNRDAEFSLKNITRKKLLDELEATRMAVRDALEQVSKKELEKDYPHKFGGETVTTEQFLLHMLGHLNYHMGQINYHRRLLANVAVAELKG
jgi:uncharacterized damage-inducible protein DinB